MKILTLNAGSSSIKYKLFDMDINSLLAWGLVDRIGEKSSNIKYQTDKDEIKKTATLASHKEAMLEIIQMLTDKQKGAIADQLEISAIAHRVVHGGPFSEAIVVTPDVLTVIEQTIPLAPLHNPGHLAVIRVSQEIFTNSTHVLIFDTAFHQTIPDYAHIYAIPYQFYTNNKIRRYGFHGTSHKYVAKKAAEYLHVPLNALNIISIHIGNGASITAIKEGKSIDTSMGLTPLEGLIMGTRSGDIDPAVIHYLYANCNLNPDEIDTLLNKESGMKGITGENDLRIIEDKFLKGDARSKLALQMYTYRIKKYIGAYMAILGRLDAIIFTAGVGENSSIIREMTLRGLEHLDITIETVKNNTGKKGSILEISKEDAHVKVLVIPTDEEFEMSLQTLQLVGPK